MSILEDARTDVRLALHYEALEVQCVTTHTFAGVDTTTGLSNPDPADLIASWQAHCRSAFLAALAPSYQLTLITATELLLNPSDPHIVANATEARSGTRTVGGDLLTPAMVCTTTTRTQRSGRRRRGRFFMSGGTEFDIYLRTLVAGEDHWLDGVQAYAALMMAQYGKDGADDTWHWTVYSHLDAIAGGHVSDGQQEVTGTFTHAEPRWLRSRQR